MPGRRTVRTGSWIVPLAGGDVGPLTVCGNLESIHRATLLMRFPWNGRMFSQDIRLTITRPFLGGHRWWFVCPETGRSLRG